MRGRSLPRTRDWLAALARVGAQLVMHGYTHRMAGRSLSPRGLVWAHGFARGQGEFFRCDADETKARLDRASAILERAGFAAATRSFVPPAWQLSSEARDVVRGAGYEFYEILGGIVTKQGVHARRLIGWGALSRIEAHATSWWAALQRRRRPTDTRLAIHPADLARQVTTDSIRACLQQLLPCTAPCTYRAFLADREP